MIALLLALLRAHYKGWPAVVLNLALPVALTSLLQAIYRDSMDADSPAAATRAGLICALAMGALMAHRSLRDDAAGLHARLRSLGASSRALIVASFGATAVVAWVQLAIAIAWAVAVCGVRPQSVPAVAWSTVLMAGACAVITVFYAELSRIVLRKWLPQ